MEGRGVSLSQFLREDLVDRCSDLHFLLLRMRTAQEYGGGAGVIRACIGVHARSVGVARIRNHVDTVPVFFQWRESLL